MIITWHGKTDFTIKTKTKSVKIGPQISLGDLAIETPGEYEAGGVQIEVIDGTVILFSEKMTIAWMKKAKTMTDAELERLNGIDVLLLGIGGGEFTETKTALEVLGQIDPKVVIPMYIEGLEGFIKEEGIGKEGIDQYKFTLNDLPQEERKVIILNAS